MFLQSAVDRPVFAWDWILRLFGAPLCRSLGRPFPAMIDPLDTAASYLDSGRLDDAETICRTILKAKPDESSALYLMARAANARKAHGRALDYLARVENPELAHLYVEAAVAHRGLGAYAAAVRAAQQAVLLAPDVPNGYQTLANLIFHGDNYHQVLLGMHAWLKPNNYVEIGVETGASMALARHPTIAIGIDPSPRLTTPPQTICKIFPLTSDDYFARRDLRQDIEADSVDLAFIDGHHLFEQALRDFINIERFSDPKTVVLIHDCLALDALTSSRDRKTRFWIGDVWKLVLILRELRTDLNVFTIATPPSGLCVVTQLDRNSTILADDFDAIVRKYTPQTFEPDQDRRHEQAATIPNQWDAIKIRLHARHF
jgi:tetratricopeptide (TPR) repeat protein